MLGNYRASKQLGMSRVVLSSMELVYSDNEKPINRKEREHCKKIDIQVQVRCVIHPSQLSKKYASRVTRELR
jgi:hypothetical protein